MDSKNEIQHAPNDIESGNLRNLLIPLMEKVDQLREAVDSKYTMLEDVITTQKKEVSEELRKIDETITMQRSELRESISTQIQENNSKMQKVLDENAVLRKENSNLKDRLDCLETTQLSNNIIISGIPASI